MSSHSQDSSSPSSLTLHKRVSIKKNDLQFTWEKKNLNTFNELIVSWNAERPQKGFYLIQISLLIVDWSPWFDYALWGAQTQHTFECKFIEKHMHVLQDTIEVLNEKKATGYKIRIHSQEGAHLANFQSIHACVTDLSLHQVKSPSKPPKELPLSHEAIDLSVPLLSQLALPDSRNKRLCSPTSTTAVLQYHSQSNALSILKFADNVRDEAFDIYGNWVLNVAEASHFLGKKWWCYVTRFTHFDSVICYLQKRYPLIVSIKGVLPGSHLPYTSGHILVVKGFDRETQNVLCMDPAFTDNASTNVIYPLESFLAAWNDRKGLCYLLYKKM